MRRVVATRKTKETNIRVSLNLDGTGKTAVATGIPFLDHMVTLLGTHGVFDLTVKASGDLDIDLHHTNEDVGLVLGEAFHRILGTRKGIQRIGFAYVPMEEALPIWERLATAADTIGGRAVGLAARDTLRLEAGMPLYGHELSEDIDPFQAGLGFAVHLKNRCFPGHDALAKAKNDTTAPRRVGLLLGGRRVPRERYAICAGDTQVGEITSGTFSPTLQQPIAMGYVKPEFASVDQELNVDIRGRHEIARVVQLPFYKRTDR